MAAHAGLPLQLGPFGAVPCLQQRQDDRRSGERPLCGTGVAGEPERSPRRPGSVRARLSDGVQHGIPLCVRRSDCGDALLAGSIRTEQEKPARPAGNGGKEANRQSRNPTGCARNQTAPVCAVRGLCGGHLLLVLVPPERSDADALCTRLHAA